MIHQPTIHTINDALELLGAGDIRRSDLGRSMTFGPWPGVPAFGVDVLLVVDAPVVSIRLRPGVAFVPSEREALLTAINAWHAQSRWPRWFVTDRDGILMLEGDVQVPCNAGIEVEQLACFVAVAAGGARQFWERLLAGEDPAAGLMAGVADLLDGAAPFVAGASAAVEANGPDVG